MLRVDEQAVINHYNRLNEKVKVIEQNIINDTAFLENGNYKQETIKQVRETMLQDSIVALQKEIDFISNFIIEEQEISQLEEIQEVSLEEQVTNDNTITEEQTATVNETVATTNL